MIGGKAAVVAIVASIVTFNCAPIADAKTQDDRFSVVITAGDKQFTYTDTAIVPSDFTVAEEIERRCINGSISQKTQLVDTYLKCGADYRTALSVCFPLLPVTVEQAKEYINTPPQNAKIVYENGIYSVLPEKTGVAVDENLLYCQIYYCIISGDNAVTVKTVSVEPQVKQSELKPLLTLRSEYISDFSSSSRGRAHNVILTLKKLDGTCIAPGESMSFNNVVGARTVENGFEKAKIIVDGKYVDGIGGGACQACTAFYNAAVLAGLSCKVNAHTICPSYCPPGLDAMISSCSDLVVKNETDKPMFVCARAEGGKAKVQVFGVESEYKITAESVILETIEFETIEEVDAEHKYFDGSAAQGDRMLISPGKDGYVSSTYLVYEKDGKFHKRVKIRENRYKPSPQLIMIAP